MALATGASVVVLAYFSKRVLPEPLSKFELALPPLVAVLFEALEKSRKGSWYVRPVFGILAVAVATALVIALNA